MLGTHAQRLARQWQRLEPRLQRATEAFFTQLYRFVIWLRPYLHVCHLHRPVDLVLLLTPAFWVFTLGEGRPHYGEIAILLLAATTIRSAAWVYNDLLDAKYLKEAPESFVIIGLITPREGWWIFFGLLAFATLLLLFLDLTVFLWAAVALLLLLGYPFIKTRTLLTQPYMGLCFAWMVPMAQLVTDGVAQKSLWLLFTATWLWASANTLLYGMPRRNYEARAGIGSLNHLFGDNIGQFAIQLQLIAAIALWFVSQQSLLGDPFAVALLTAMALLPYQQWLLSRYPNSGPTRAYRVNIHFGLVLMIGFFAERLL
ncbi:MAG: UbiA family prenyltransferase [Chromatiales bacterium]|nr:UbiA family prenyltransferase [Chromatiales bacterium]